MQLRFDPSEIQPLADSYVSRLNERDRRLTANVVDSVVPRYVAAGFLTKSDFLTICEWKTSRTKSRCASNDAKFIREISSLSLTTSCEQLRIQVWTLLHGVNWPTASVFLHFSMPDRYPILDFRAIWSLESVVPKQYNFDYWNRYVECCRTIANENDVSMRTLDQSLWEYSKRHQNTNAV